MEKVNASATLEEKQALISILQTRGILVLSIQKGTEQSEYILKVKLPH